MDTKLKFQCAVYMRDHGINIYSASPNIVKILTINDFARYIPGYRISKKPTKSGYSLIYIPKRHFSAMLINNNKTLKILGSEQEVIKGNTLPYIIHFMLEPQRQKDSQLTCNAAGSSFNNKGVLLIGKRGSGKTSISLELCRKYKYSLIGADLLLVKLKKDGAYILEGTKIFKLRLTIVNHYNTDLKKFFKNQNSQDDWINKIEILPQKLGISTKNGPIKITQAFYVHLENDPSAPLYIKKINKNDTLYMGRLYLYEELSRYIRGTCIPLLKGSKPDIANYLPSLDKPEYHKHRVDLINWIIDELGLYYIAGGMDAICNYINSRIKDFPKKIINSKKPPGEAIQPGGLEKTGKEVRRGLGGFPSVFFDLGSDF